MVVFSRFCSWKKLNSYTDDNFGHNSEPGLPKAVLMYQYVRESTHLADWLSPRGMQNFPQRFYRNIIVIDYNPKLLSIPFTENGNAGESKDTDEELNASSSRSEDGKTPSFTVLLHGSLKVEGMVALTKVRYVCLFPDSWSASHWIYICYLDAFALQMHTHTVFCC